MVTTGFNGFYLVLLGFTGFYRVFRLLFGSRMQPRTCYGLSQHGRRPIENRIKYEPPCPYPIPKLFFCYFFFTEKNFFFALSPPFSFLLRLFLCVRVSFFFQPGPFSLAAKRRRRRRRRKRRCERKELAETTQRKAKHTHRHHENDKKRGRTRRGGGRRRRRRRRRRRKGERPSEKSLAFVPPEERRDPANDGRGPPRTPSSFTPATFFQRLSSPAPPRLFLFRRFNLFSFCCRFFTELTEVDWPSRVLPSFTGFSIVIPSSFITNGCFGFFILILKPNRIQIYQSYYIVFLFLPKFVWIGFARFLPSFTRFSIVIPSSFITNGCFGFFFTYFET